MGMYGERLGRGVTREAARKYETSVTERARRERWRASGCARVASRNMAPSWCHMVPTLPPC